MSTPAGIGGIAVVELSGRDSEMLLRAVFHSRTADLAPARLSYGRVVRSGEIIDEVLVARIPVEGEAAFEIHCHGGMVPARRIIGGFVADGAEETDALDVLAGRRLRKLERRIAGQLIHARTARAADVLLVQLAGRLRGEIEKSRSDCAVAEKLAATWSYGRRLIEPATVVIAGAPNVGKSTLANVLVGRERSIVHPLPGTTRDAVTSVASLDGLPVVVVDTAGLREAAEEIERIGVERAVERAGECDVVVWVFDHSRDVTPDEARRLDAFRGKRLVPVVNKIDLDGPLTPERVREITGSAPLNVCALSGRGVDELRSRLVAEILHGPAPERDAAVVTFADVAEALLDTRASKSYLDDLLS